MTEKIRHDGLASIIKYEGDNETLVWKHPIEDFNLGSQLIVHESQEAVFFKDGQAFMPRYITAADVMKREVPVLPESGTIQDCIDAFIREKTSEIAVVDVEGRLKGVARADRLLEICLPEYMHWMGDISPVLDFEPFAQILQNEHVTPLVRIMSDEVPVVAPDAPAVQVSYAMMRSKSPRCYVCRDGKLAGAVKLVDFLNKVFRE